MTFTVDTLSNFTYRGNVTLGSPANVMIPWDFMVTNSSKSQRQKGIHVKAERNKKITVFGTNRNRESTDAFLALPCSRLPVVQYEYYAVNYLSLPSDRSQSFVLLVGCENSTTITTSQSIFTLNRLETYLMYNSVTGTKIVADNPIVFYSGNECISLSGEHCGHLIEQLPPTYAWGTFFLSGTSVPDKQVDSTFFRAVAAHDETVISITCNSTGSHYTSTLHLGLGTHQDSPLIFGISCVIEANHPILVVKFQRISEPYGGHSYMSFLPPADQYNNNNYRLPFWNTGYVYQHYVTITVLPQYFDKNKIYMDNFRVSAVWNYVRCLNGTICGYTTTTTAGHLLRHTDDNARIGGIIFGLGNSDAYGCPAGFHFGSLSCK